MTETTPYYRTVIQEELAKRCDKNPRYSLRAFAKAAGVDVAGLSRVLSGKSLPSAKATEKFLKFLDLTPEQQARFVESLSTAHRSRDYQRLSPAFKERNVGTTRELSVDLFRVISDWYHYAILELTFTRGFQPNPTWIAAQLGITPMEAKLAIDRMIQLGLLEAKNGKIAKSSERITTADKHLSAPALRRRQKQVLEKSAHSLENDDISVRSHTAMTMAIDPKRLEKAKEMIRRFNRELCDYLEGGDRTQVYELSIGLFPIQKRSEK